MMDDQSRVAELYAEALEFESEERLHFLNNACADRPTIMAEVKSLLDFNQKVEAESFLSAPALELEARQLADESAQSLIGASFGPYKIIEEIGRGGMGAVYLASRADEQYESLVAIKVIKRGMDTDHILRSFRNERQILAYLNHPNIVRLFDGGTTIDGVPYFIMDYIKGQPIQEYCDEKRLSIDERLRLFLKVCDAVQYAHQNLIVHRDLKPSNILVMEDGVPKLLDFGIAKILSPDSTNQEQTETNVRAMTPEYASPEQVNGERITTVSDIYSLGVILYELLAGHRPYNFAGRTPAEVAEIISELKPDKPSTAVTQVEVATSPGKPGTISAQPEQVSASRRSKPAELRRQLRGDLDNIVMKAMRKEPGRRYASVEQFSEDIERYLGGLPVRARKDTFTYRASKFINRNKFAVVAATLILLTLISGIIAIAWSARAAHIERARAEQRFNEVRKLAHSVLFDYDDELANLPDTILVRGKLVKDTLEYLDGLERETSDDSSLQRELAAAYLKVGDVQGRPYSSNLGQTKEALASYRKALAILETLSAREPSNLEIRRYLATAYERIGSLQLRENNLEEAFNKTSQALTLREGLLSANPANVNYRRELADSYIYFGDALNATCYSLETVECGRQALESQRKALAVREELAQENPSDPQLRRDLAQAYTRIGFRLSMLAGCAGDKEYLRQSLESHNRSLAIREELVVADPKNARDLRNLADQYMLRSDSQVENGDVVGALKGYRRAIEIFKPLSSVSPSNTEAHLDLSFAYNKLAAALAKTGNLAAAEENYNEALQVHQRWLANDPDNVEGSQALLASYLGLSALSEKAGDYSRAIENYSKFMDLYKQIAHLRAYPARALEMAYYYDKLGDLYVKSAILGGVRGHLQSERWRAAKDYYQKSLDIWQDLKSQGKLQGADLSKPDEVVRELAKCEAALK